MRESLRETCTRAMDMAMETAMATSSVEKTMDTTLTTWMRKEVMMNGHLSSTRTLAQSAHRAAYEDRQRVTHVADLHIPEGDRAC